MTRVDALQSWPGRLASLMVLLFVGHAWAEQPTAAPMTKAAASEQPAEAQPVEPLDAAALATAKAWAAQVTIYRDAYGVPHVDGQTDEATLFGFAYAQAEDYFWQVEDSYILSQGRYSEVHGPRGLNSDLLNRAYEIVPQARATFAKLEPELVRCCTAFTAGLNYYLHTHPDVKPRLINRFEPWQVLAFGRHMMLEVCFRRSGLSNNYLPRAQEMVWASSGSNGWAIAPAKSQSGHALLLVNPHLPWFGFAQLFEAHLRSGSGWNFTGATTYGNPMFSLGHNENLGWTLTTNEPDIADVWRVTFDDPAQPDRYRFGEGYRSATVWQESVGVLQGDAVVPRNYTLRKTHHGPIVGQEEERVFLAAKISGLDSAVMLRQTMAMVRSRSWSEFRRALDLQQFALMNLMYADREGNIFYLYNGLIPRRDEQFDWSAPVDGSNPQAAWREPFKVSELPQVLNPACGYVQNCNSSPFTTSASDNPAPDKFPRYLAEDADRDNRRAKRSREILDASPPLTLESLGEKLFDTTVYWAQHDMPRIVEQFADIAGENPRLAAEVEPLLKHLMAWDGRITADSTAATLCEAWYGELYGRLYPAETLRPRFEKDPVAVFRALTRASAGLSAIHGTWRVRWADVHRTQRHTQTADLFDLPFEDRLPSFPSLAAPGPMGVIFTQYYSPSIKIPLLRTLKNQYGLIGPTYMAVYEFGPQVRGATLVCNGTSGDPDSPHFTDQAELLSQGRLKPELFAWDAVRSAAKRTYHPGE